MGTDIAAWWGAITATVVICWDVYKWIMSGARVRIEVRSGVSITGDENKDKSYITVRVFNVGDKAVTITNLELLHSPSFLNRILRHRQHRMFVKQSSLPFMLNPGLIWDGFALQNEQIAELLHKGYLLCSISLSCKRRLNNQTCPTSNRLTNRSVIIGYSFIIPDAENKKTIRKAEPLLNISNKTIH